MKKMIGKSLQTVRKAAGFKSAKAFAQQMGYNVGTYTNWEQGKQIFSFEQAWEMADALGCTLDELGGRAHARQDTVPDDERRLLEAYRASDGRGQLTILAAAEREASMPDAVAKKDARLSA